MKTGGAKPGARQKSGGAMAPSGSPLESPLVVLFFPHILVCFDSLPSTIVLHLNVSAMPLTVNRKIAFSSLGLFCH